MGSRHIKDPRLQRLDADLPPGLSRATFSRWRQSFQLLMQMLRDRVQPVDGLGPPGDRPHQLEFMALHKPGPAGRTLGTCASLHVDKLPAEIRPIAAALSGSTWELFEVVGRQGTGLLLRRIHDDTELVFHAFEGHTGLFAGEVYALRLLNAGRFLASTAPIHIRHRDVMGLAARLEHEFASRSVWTWPEYLHVRGSELILAYVVEPPSAELSIAPPGIDPLTSPSHTAISRRTWRRLARWYGRLRDVRYDARCQQMEPPSGGSVCVYGRPDCPVIEVRDDKEGPDFCRIWSSSETGHFPEDAAWSSDDTPPVLAARQDASKIWHDLTEPQLEMLIGTLRWLAVQFSLGESRAA